MSVLPIMVIVGFLISTFVIIWLTRRYFKQRNTALGTVDTPGYTENKIDDQHVLITFRPQGKQPITIEHYFDKSQYKSPQDFRQLNKNVTVKYDPNNPSNYTVYDEVKGDYTKYIAPVLVGALIGSLAVSTSEEPGDWVSKTKTFLITFAITAIVVYIIVRLNSYFSFLNILTKKEE